MNTILKTEGKDYVIASDTDSIYLHMGDLVEAVYKGREKLLKALSRSLIRSVKWNLVSYIESSYQELADYVNAYDQKMIMKRRILPIEVYGLQRKDIF